MSQFATNRWPVAMQTYSSRDPPHVACHQPNRIPMAGLKDKRSYIGKNCLDLWERKGCRVLDEALGRNAGPADSGASEGRSNDEGHRCRVGQEALGARSHLVGGMSETLSMVRPHPDRVRTSALGFWLARSAIACVAGKQLLIVNDFSLEPRWLAPALEPVLPMTLKEHQAVQASQPSLMEPITLPIAASQKFPSATRFTASGLPGTN